MLTGVVLGASVLATPAASAASSICSKVSTSSVEAIVGHSVPAPVQQTVKLPATKKNDEISTVQTTCTYGAETSEAALAKDVILQSQVASKAYTLSELKASIAKNSTAAAAIKLKSYSGLGVPGFYFTENISGIHAEGLAGFQGTRSYGADVFTTTLSESKLAALTKLAQAL